LYCWGSNRALQLDANDDLAHVSPRHVPLPAPRCAPEP
jgi:hypothetical protein